VGTIVAIVMKIITRLHPIIILLCWLNLTIVFPLKGYAEPESITYTVTGTVKGLPGTGRAPNELLIAHEPIPEYRDVSGKVVGMNGMVMPFYLENGVSLSGIQVGDRIQFGLMASWDPVFKERVVSLKKLN